jgi:hypothetical protein
MGLVCRFCVISHIDISRRILLTSVNRIYKDAYEGRRFNSTSLSSEDESASG